MTTELVFRTVGERTTELALKLAIENIRPQRVEVIKDFRPFSAAMKHLLAIEHDCDQVVHMDADCLILDDMTPFLERNRRPYVDCYVSDRFRGRIHCGVHITRIDVIRKMREIGPQWDDIKYVLRPESRLRNIALRNLRRKKEFRNFNILHDHFQYYRDIFAKYAMRELRSRTAHQRARLEEAQGAWEQSYDLDIVVARLAMEHARRSVPDDASAAMIARYVERLPRMAVEELDRAGIKEKAPLDLAEVEGWVERHPPAPYEAGGRPRVFGVGLSRTGTHSLTQALHILGWDTVHYPADADTFEELSNGDYDLSVLKEYNGITDITVAPYFAQLDSRFPGSKFILTVRDREGWLRSCHEHWNGRSAFQETSDPEEETYMKMRRFLRAAVFGCYGFDPERFSWVYDQHHRAVTEHFRDRPHDLLVLDVCSGHGWRELCSFLGVPVPAQPFPHKAAKATKKLEARQQPVFDSGVHVRVATLIRDGAIAREDETTRLAS